MFAGAFVAFAGIFMMIAIGSIIAHIFYLITLSNTIEACHPFHRKMNPGQVWMVFIPIYGIIWYFMMIGHIADTIAAEYRYRNLQCDEERPGYNYGLWSMILRLCAAIPFLGILAGLVGIVFWIMHWSKIAGYKKTLEQTAMNGGIGNPYHGYQQYPHVPQQYPYPPTQYPPTQYPNQYPHNQQPPYPPYPPVQ